MNRDEFEQTLGSIKNAFENAKNAIGAKDSGFRLVPRELKDPIGKFNAGRPISGVELQKISENWKSKTPLIDEDGNAFVLFIPDFSTNFHRRDISNPENLPKYHVAWCSTLEYMTEIGRARRYIKKTDIENNLFKGKKDNDADMATVLYACQNCRTTMRKICGHEPYFDVKNMDLLQFFTKYGNTNLVDPGTARTYSVMYPKHWDAISKQHRERVGWVCDKCKRSFKDAKYNLDVHHINGIRSDVRDVNLRVLCKKCHSEEPNHNHYKHITNEHN